MFMPRQENFARDITLAHPLRPTDPVDPNPPLRQAEGMLSGTLVETSKGWMQIERLGAGAKVYTQDGGLRQVKAMRHQRRGSCPRVLIPGGALGNDAALELPADQLVLVDGRALETLFDMPLALARAGDLLGFAGIRALAPDTRTDLWQMIFDEEELVWTAGALRVHCPSRDCTREGFFERLSTAQARLYALSMSDACQPVSRVA